MPRTASPFTTNWKANNPNYLDVRIADRATVLIKRDEEGVVIDVYPLNDTHGEPCASAWVHLHDLAPDEQPPAPPLAPWQRVALNCYDLGEFRYLAETETPAALHEGLRDCGDSLLRFIVAELSAREDCTSFPDAVRRMTTARNQLNDLIEDLQEAADAPAAVFPFSAHWRIDLDAPSPQDAAKEALAIQRDPASTATHFTVRDNATGETTSIDLLDAGEGG